MVRTQLFRNEFVNTKLIGLSLNLVDEISVGFIRSYKLPWCFGNRDGRMLLPCLVAIITNI